MKFRIENINKVHKADISLNGLTVIAGPNSSGKSTIGKMLFSTIKTLSNTNENKEYKRQDLLRKYTMSLYKRMDIRKLNSEVLFPFSITKFINELTSLDSEDESSVTHFFTLREKAINEMDISPRIKSLMLQDLENIEICLNAKDNRAADIATEVLFFIESEFMNNICSHQTEQSYAELFDDVTKAKVSFLIKNNKIDEVKIEGKEYLQDATYIESPLYLHLLDSLLYATTFRETSSRKIFLPMLPSHIKDMAEKIDSMRLIGYNRKSLSYTQEIESLAGGRFKFDNKSRNLYFEKGGVLLSPINVASGVKSFGVIQMLLETDAINENKILIWDEPENHLHPEWQVEFANILVELAKSGIPVVISTHSPYFIQGIRYHAAKHNIEKYVNYYLAEEDKHGLSVIKEVTNDLNAVFIKLAEPLNNIMNIDLVRSKK